MKKNNKGFSLVELIVVIAIMAILAAVAIPTFATFINRANESSDASFINDFIYAAELAHATSNDEITAVQVTISNGEITGAAYKVGDEVVSINASTKAVTCEDSDIAKAAELTVSTIDWDYTFKSEKTGTFELNSDNKLASVEPLQGGAGAGEGEGEGEGGNP